MFAVTAQAQECSRPPGGENMDLKGNDILLTSFPDGITVTFACNTGYESAGGIPRITCTAGSWSNLSLKCQRKSCDSAGDVLNGQIEYRPGTEFGDSAVLICNPCYMPVGGGDLICGDKGWMGRLPVCEVKHCDSPPEVAYGSFSPKQDTYECSNAVSYTCTSDYTLVGSRQLHCSDDETFKPEPPRCITSLQLQCDKREITAHVGGEFILKCNYDTKYFLYSKKYWCRGTSRSNCEIVADSESGRNTHRSQVIDLNRRGLFVKVTNLRFDDAGVYWVGIDEIYTDIMTQVKVIITEVPVSKPRLWPLSSLVDRPTCWGKSVTLRCGCAKGTGVRYAWHQHIDNKDFLLHKSSDLYLHCGTVQKDCSYYCIASNDISSEKSELIAVWVLMPSNSSCIYVVNIQGQPVYDCADRMTTTTVTAPPLTSCLVIVNSDKAINQSLQLNETTEGFFFNRALAGLPLWYTLLRWGSFLALLITLWTAVTCTRRRYKKYANQKKNFHFRRIYRAAH